MSVYEKTGSEYIGCKPPLFTDIVPEFQVAVPIAILSGKVSQATHALASAGVEIDAQAIKMGYATFPLDFDPVWVRNCAHYTPHRKSGIVVQLATGTPITLALPPTWKKSHEALIDLCAAIQSHNPTETKHALEEGLASLTPPITVSVSKRHAEVTDARGAKKLFQRRW